MLIIYFPNFNRHSLRKAYSKSERDVKFNSKYHEKQ